MDPNDQSAAHDPDVLPHEYSDHDLEEIFMKAEVPDDCENAPVSRCMCGRPDCEQCFPPHPPEFGPPVIGLEAWMAKGTHRYPRRAADM